MRKNGLKVKSLGSSLLSSSEQMQLTRKMQARGDSKRRWTDFDMLDALKEVSDPSVWSETRRSCIDKHLTRLYRCNSVLESELRMFVSPDTSNRMWQRNVRVGFALLRKAMQPRLLDPIPLTEDCDPTVFWTNKKASPGAINLGSTKELNAERCLDIALTIKREVAAGTPFKDIWVPNVALPRCYLKKLETPHHTYNQDGWEYRIRLLWCADGGTMTFEAQYGLPLQWYEQKVWQNFMGGKDPRQQRRLIRKYWRRGRKFWTSVDFSKFDQTLPAWLIKGLFDVIKMFYAQEHWADIDWICYNFIHSKIILPGGEVLEKAKGIPSGSNFTSIIGSMANFVVVTSYLASLCDGNFEDKLRYVQDELWCIDNADALTILVMGDDNLVFTQNPIDIADLAAYAKHVFGMMIHTDVKEAQGKDEPPVFLSRTWCLKGEWREPLTLFIGLTHPERERSYDTYSPWHILYGIYLTYSLDFPSWVDEAFLISKMKENGGVDRLGDLPRDALPGVLQIYSDSTIQYLLARAKAIAARESTA